jgi:3-dehydrosphinganine reductase
MPQVDAALEKYNVVPDILFCVSGGSNSEQLGFLTDMEPHGIKSCMESNYYSAVFITRAVLRLWLKSPVVDYTRHIVFTASTAAFVALPGYVAYTPPKVAVRALADTLRQELLLYGGKDKYQVHCSFPGTFTSEAFLAEAETKPKLTMILEGSDMTEEQLKKTKQSSAEVAQLVIKGLERGEFFITVDFEGELLLNNMRGPSPRHRPVYDFFLGFVAVIVWFFVRRDFDKKIAKFGLKEKLRN